METTANAPLGARQPVTVRLVGGPAAALTDLDRPLSRVLSFSAP